MEFELKKSIPKLKCGRKSATAFMVSDKIAITATHAIEDYLDNNDPIELIFISNNNQKINAVPIDEENWENQPIVVLKLEKEISDLYPLKCVNHEFSNYQSECGTFGYPLLMGNDGTFIKMSVTNEIDAESYKTSENEWNLVLMPEDTIEEYSGLSGGPLLFNNKVVGVFLKEKIESSRANRVAAVSLYLYKDYLESLGLDLIKESNVKKLDSDDIILGIRSFKRDTENMSKETDEMLCLLDFFNKKQIKEDYEWNKDIFSELEKFKKELDPNFTYKLNLQTHLSIAFVMGYLCDSISGIEVYPKQNTRGTSDWTPKEDHAREYPKLEHNIKFLSEEPKDVVLVLGIRHKILGAVEEYVKDNRIEVSKIINCNVDGNIGLTAIIDGTHAIELANNISGILNEGRNTQEKRNKLHIFASCPVGFMFYLGQLSRSFGKIVLYEYDNFVYLPSFELPI